MKYRDATSVRIFFLNGDFESSGVMDRTHHVLNRTTSITHAPFAGKLPKKFMVANERKLYQKIYSL